MKVRGILVFALAAALIAFLPGGAPAKKATGKKAATYEVHMDEANIAVAANGDRLELGCASRGGVCGSFSVHPKSLPDPPSGEFVHTDSEGNVLGGGTWTATKLISFHAYGCRFIPAIGVDLGSDDLCGGALKLRTLLETTAGDFRSTLTVFCVVGPKAPKSHNRPPEEEGVTLSIPGVINFNHTGGGENIYVQQ